MFGLIARTVQYAVFFARLTAQHVAIEEFDSSRSCARVTVIETGFPGNEVCIEGAWTPSHIDVSDVTFEAQPEPEPATAQAAESDTPEIVHKGRF